MEVGYYFVEDQYYVVFVVGFVQVFEEVWCWWYVVYVVGNWFDDDVGDFFVDFVQGFVYCFDVVEWQGQGVFGEGCWNVWGVWYVEGQGVGVGFYQQVVGVVVVVVFEFDDVVVFGVVVGQVDGVYGCFGVGVDYVYYFY